MGALALPAVTLPLALRRRAPALPLVAIALVLPLQAALGGLLVEQGVVPLAALVFALYSAGRHIAGAREQVVAGVAIAVVVATKLAWDPALDDPAAAFWMIVYTPVPLLVGRWLRAQALLRGELREQGEQLERQRERNARHAAEAERMRIATDLQSAVAGGLASIREQATRLSSSLAERDHVAARELSARIAAAGARGARRRAPDPRRAPPRRPAAARARRVAACSGPGGPPPGRGRTDAPARAAIDPPSAPASAPVSRSSASDAPARAATARRRAPAAGPDSVFGRGRRALGRLDGALVPLLAIGGAIELAAVAPDGERAIAALTALPVAAALHWRRRHPVAVVAAVLAAIAVQSVIVDPERFPVSGIAAVVCAAYGAGASAPRHVALAGLALALLGSALHAAVFHPGAVVAAVVGGVAVPWVFGRTVRTRRRLTAELREQAARLEEAREQEAQAAIVAERARVARELHDAVAHSLSVIAIQAAGAGGIAERDPERAARSSALIESVGRDALVELARLVAPPGAPPSRPGLAGVGALTQRARDGGLPVELRIEGEPASLPAGVDLAAFRIVQEALANAAKHARAGRAWVVVRYERDAVELEVADDGRGANGSAPARDGGHGLVGMRERVALYDGTLDVGNRPSGGFRVHARLPL